MKQSLRILGQTSPSLIPNLSPALAFASRGMSSSPIVRSDSRSSQNRKTPPSNGPSVLPSSTEPYLPPNWTEARYKAATAHDVLSLSEDQRNLLFARRQAETDLHTPRSRLQELVRKQQVQRVAAGLAPLPPEVIDEQLKGTSIPQFVEVLHRMDIQGKKWGFRLILEGDDCSAELIQEMAKNGMRDEVGKRKGLEWAVGSARLWHGNRDVRSDDVTAEVVLQADEESVRSILRPRKGEVPWLWAIDPSFSVTNTTKTGYQGRLKVAVKAVFTELWVGIYEEDLESLWSFERDIWEFWT